MTGISESPLSFPLISSLLTLLPLSQEKKKKFLAFCDHLGCNSYGRSRIASSLQTYLLCLLATANASLNACRITRTRGHDFALSIIVLREAQCILSKLVLLRIGLDRHLDGSLCLLSLGMGTSEKSLPSLCIEYIYNGVL